MTAEFPWAHVDKPTLQVLAWHSMVMQGRATREDIERTFGEATATTLAITKKMTIFTMKDPMLRGPQ